MPLGFKVMISPIKSPMCPAPHLQPPRPRESITRLTHKPLMCSERTHKTPWRSLIGVLVLILCVAYEGRAKAAELSLDQLPYPGAVALSSDNGKWTYKSFPSLLALYIFEGEPEGQSTCDKTCSAVWPIIQAQRSDKPMGLWTIVQRDDGRLQWAFRNKPLYTYFEDSSTDVRGIGKNMDWYLDEGAIAYLKSVGVLLPESAAQAERKPDGKKTLSVLLPPLN